MSFISKNVGAAYLPGWFLAADELCERQTKQMDAAKGVAHENGGKYIPMGTIWPTNDANAAGIVYEDIDVTNGNMPGSVVTRGTVYVDRLAASFGSGAKAALEEKGFVFIDEAPDVTRPY